MEHIIDTERLYLREMTAADIPALSLILQDEKAMYAYEHAFSDQEVLDWLEKNLNRYKNDGFGLWAVILKENDSMIGQCGLTYQSLANDSEACRVVEIGYLFQRAYWHHGYATEAAIACKKYAFDTLKIKKVYSIIRDSNFASQAVAKRNGMKVESVFVKHYMGIDMPHIVFCTEAAGGCL